MKHVKKNMSHSKVTVVSAEGTKGKRQAITTGGRRLSYCSTVDGQAAERLQNHSFPLVNVLLLTSTQRRGLADGFLE